MGELAKKNSHKAEIATRRSNEKDHARLAMWPREPKGATIPL